MFRQSRARCLSRRSANGSSLLLLLLTLCALMAAISARSRSIPTEHMTTPKHCAAPSTKSATTPIPTPTSISPRRRHPHICMQPPPRSEGICTIEIEGYYFDKRTNDCELYVIGGCRSSPGQSFGSRQDCLATCVHGTRRIQDLRGEGE